MHIKTLTYNPCNLPTLKDCEKESNPLCKQQTMCGNSQRFVKNVPVVIFVRKMDFHSVYLGCANHQVRELVSQYDKFTYKNLAIFENFLFF